MSRDIDLGIQGLREGDVVEQALIAAGVFAPPDPDSEYDVARVGSRGDGHLWAFDVDEQWDEADVFNVAASATEHTPIDIHPHVLVLANELNVDEATLRQKLEEQELTQRLIEIQ